MTTERRARYYWTRRVGRGVGPMVMAVGFGAEGLALRHGLSPLPAFAWFVALTIGWGFWYHRAKKPL